MRVFTLQNCDLNLIVLVFAPKLYRQTNQLRTLAPFVLLRCTLLQHKDLLWTHFNFPPSHTIAYQTPAPSSHNIVDLFTGIGTWTLASHYLSEHRVICAVDLDRHALLTQSATFDMPLYELTPQLYTQTDQPFLLRHDVTDHSLLPLFALFSPVLFCASPPCPPWSNAGTQLGFNRHDGALTLHCFFLVLLTHASHFRASCRLC